MFRHLNVLQHGAFSTIQKKFLHINIRVKNVAQGGQQAKVSRRF